MFYSCENWPFIFTLTITTKCKTALTTAQLKTTFRLDAAHKYFSLSDLLLHPRVCPFRAACDLSIFYMTSLSYNVDHQ